jgi:RHS repeat-associated protein
MRGIGHRFVGRSAGAVTDSYIYDAFGNTVGRTGTTVNSYQYRGEQFVSSLGMYYLRARYYAPRTGRFLSADKYEGEEIAACDCSSLSQRVPLVGTHHLFEYSNADPVNYSDPTGRDTIFATVLRWVKITGAVVTGLATVGEGIRLTICKGWNVLKMANDLGLGNPNFSDNPGSNKPLDVFCRWINVLF